MNDHVLSFLNAVGAQAGLAALWITLQAAVLVGVLLAVDRLLRHRIRAALRHGLWMLVLLKFVLPPGFLSPTSLAYWIAPRLAEPIRVVSFTGSPKVGPLAASSTEIPVGALTAGFTPAPVSLQLPGILALVWLAGIGVWTTAVLVRNRRIQALVRGSEPAPETLVQLLEEAADRLHIDRLPSIRLTRTAYSPALFGFFRPVILLPRELPERIGPEALRQVLRHELVHLARRDLWFHGFQVAVQALWWWNPLVGWVNARIRALREEAVDEAVMLEPDSESYPSTLVAVARHCAMPSGLSLALLSILESRSRLEKRVRRLVEQPLPRSARMGWTGWIAVVLAGALFVPMGFARRVENRRANTSTESTSGNGIDLGLDSAEPVDRRALGQDTRPQVLVNGISPISRIGSGAAFNKEFTALQELRKRYKASHPNVREQLRKTYQLWREAAREASEPSETDDDLMQKASEWLDGHDRMFPGRGENIVPAATVASTATPHRMSPELAKRYGLAVSTNTPPPPTPQSVQPTPMPPEMARRYGLLPATPQAPAPAVTAAPAASAPGLPTRQQVVTWAQSVDQAGNPPAPGLPSKQQVLIESRFLEFHSGMGPNLERILGTNRALPLLEATATAFLDASERLDGVDILSAPRVVTVLNTGAEVSVQEEKRVRIASAKGTEETTVRAGPRLQFTISEVPRNPNALALTADASVVQVLGNPEAKDDALGREVINNVGTGSARLWDRQALLLDAGTFTNRVRFVDKVPTLGDIPLLGRLFRTEGTQEQVRRILVLVTPTLIDPAGSPVNNDPKRLPFDPATFPPEN